MVQLSPQSTHPRCKVSCQGVSTCIIALPVLHQGQPDGGESCIVLESRLTLSLVANLPKCLLLVVHEFRTAGEERCEQGYEWVCAKP